MSRAGLTLLEVLIGLVLLGVLVTAVAPVLRGFAAGPRDLQRALRVQDQYVRLDPALLRRLLAEGEVPLAGEPAWRVALLGSETLDAPGAAGAAAPLPILRLRCELVAADGRRHALPPRYLVGLVDGP